MKRTRVCLPTNPNGSLSVRCLFRRIVLVMAGLALLASGCAGGSSDSESSANTESVAPKVLVTTGIWADIVANVACDGIADVETVVPVGGDPHGFEPSLRDRERMENAELVVANGFDLELRLEDTLGAVEASGTPVFEVAEQIESIPFSSDHDDHAEDDDTGDDHGVDHDDHGVDHDDHGVDHDDHGVDHDDHGVDHDDHGVDHDDHGVDHDDHGVDDDHTDEDDGHGHGSADPHVWFDPVRVSGVLNELAHRLTDDAGIDGDAVAACLSDYQAELAALDQELEALLEQLPAGGRKLVTNHDALGYFADRYGFEIIGTVLPSPTAISETNPAQLEELARTIEHEGVRAIFAETVHSSDDAEALASRVGDVKVVTLYTGSLGPPGSGAEDYVGFMRTNARLIVDALG